MSAAFHQSPGAQYSIRWPRLPLKINVLLMSLGSCGWRPRPRPSDIRSGPTLNVWTRHLRFQRVNNADASFPRRQEVRVATAPLTELMEQPNRGTAGTLPRWKPATAGLFRGFFVAHMWNISSGLLSSRCDLQHLGIPEGGVNKHRYGDL